jgi:hypothetical protein
VEGGAFPAFPPRCWMLELRLVEKGGVVEEGFIVLAASQRFSKRQELLMSDFRWSTLRLQDGSREKVHSVFVRG